MGLLARTTLGVVAAAALCTGPLAAQASVFIGGGISNPMGDLSDRANSGYHAAAALRVGVPTIPVSLSLDGAYHRLGEASTSFSPTKVLSGSLNVVFELPGVGLRPYLLAGVGRHRIEAGSAQVVTLDHERGFQAGFGLELGAAGFVEMRYIQIETSPSRTRLVPLTFGWRL